MTMKVNEFYIKTVVHGIKKRKMPHDIHNPYTLKPLLDKLDLNYCIIKQKNDIVSQHCAKGH